MLQSARPYSKPYLKPLLEIAQKIIHVSPHTGYRVDTPALKTQALRQSSGRGRACPELVEWAHPFIGPRVSIKERMGVAPPRARVRSSATFSRDALAERSLRARVKRSAIASRLNWANLFALKYDVRTSGF